MQQKTEPQQVNGAVLVWFGRGKKLLSSDQVFVSESQGVYFVWLLLGEIKKKDYLQDYDSYLG